MVDRTRQRLAPGVRNQRRQPCRKALLQARLQRVIIRDSQILEKLDVGVQSHGSVRPRARAGRAGCAEDYWLLIQIPKSWQLQPAISDVSKIEHDVADQLA